jgi:hypothetical protein
MPNLILPCPAGEVSDGCHTFNELYDHRCLLFIALMKAYPERAWRARLHEDGSGMEGWWIGGMHLPTGDITYHIPEEAWGLLDHAGVATLERGPRWDGHTSADVLQRLRHWIAAGQEQVTAGRS